VFNYILPEVPETYVHRIGRTAGLAGGTAISFATLPSGEYRKAPEKRLAN
jgi:superfamily II DNA/RNA helicase